jgi:hypothetical protein
VLRLRLSQQETALGRALQPRLRLQLWQVQQAATT